MTPTVREASQGRRQPDARSRKAIQGSRHDVRDKHVRTVSNAIDAYKLMRTIRDIVHVHLGRQALASPRPADNPSASRTGAAPRSGSAFSEFVEQTEAGQSNAQIGVPIPSTEAAL